MESITVKAYAKINMCLYVTGRRDDGYHLLRTMMQNIALCDLVTLKKIPSGITIEVTGHSLPVGEENIAYKAAEVFFKETEVDGGINIIINKKIPVAAGLAGGSADAAAVLKGLNVLFETGLHNHKLASLGEKLGADVPFCVIGGSVLAEGIGERIQLLPALKSLPIVLVKPDFEVSTPFIYKNFKFSDDERNSDGLLASLREGDYDMFFRKGCSNDLEATAFSYYPEIEEIKTEMLKRGAVFSLMCGSGPTVFGVAKTVKHAEEIAKIFNKKYNSVYTTHTI